MTDRVADAERQAQTSMPTTDAEQQAVAPVTGHDVVAPMTEDDAHATAAEHGAPEQPVFAPDQLRAYSHAKGLKIGGVLTAIALVVMVFGPGHEGNISKTYLVGFAAFILFLIVIDRVLRHRGLKR
jgi:hypothetical protein